MGHSPDLSRRRFVQGGAGLSTAALFRLGAPALIALSQGACSARQQGTPFRVLSAREGDDLSSIAARILPTTDTPGATEAGVIYFFDAALADVMSDTLPYMRRELVSFNAALSAAYPQTDRFSRLPELQQDEFLREREDSDFFGLVRVMTLFGMFAMSRYGGNRENIGWQLIGFEGGHGGWQYPFGYYDAEVHGGGNHGS